ncbi:hypothetical protein JCM10207_003089 [Rhodosporidiobolus poonsookiae]
MSAAAAAPTVTISTLPPELLLKILLHACTTTRFSQELVVHNQFASLETHCRSCVFRNVAGVSKEWRAVAREIMGREVAFANGCGSSERDEAVLRFVEKDARRAAGVKKVDASLRRAMCGWAGWPAATNEPATLDSESIGDTGAITSQGVELERWREQCLNRERQRLYRLLTVCRNITELDIDVGFYAEVRAGTTLLPKSIRKLTLRNAESLDTLTIVNQLPLLEDLTLRLALDWYLPSSPCAHLLKGACRLRRFELSTTAFGTTTLASILALLANSHETLTALSLRNKGGASGVVDAFTPVAQGLIKHFAGTLEELTIKDLPRGGLRPPSIQPSADWFPASPTSMPRLQHLHLTGLPLPSSSFFTRTIVLPSPSALRSLTLEDFDALSAAPLVDALAAPALQRLEELSVAFAKEVEMVRREGAWEAEREAVEGWCAGKGREEGRTTRLKAGWQMVKVSGCGLW